MIRLGTNFISREDVLAIIRAATDVAQIKERVKLLHHYNVGKVEQEFWDSVVARDSVVAHDRIKEHHE